MDNKTQGYNQMPALLLLLKNKYVYIPIIILITTIILITSYCIFISHIKHKEDIKIHNEQLISQEHLFEHTTNLDLKALDDYQTNLNTYHTQIIVQKEQITKLIQSNPNWSSTNIPTNIKNQLNIDFKE
mgnify:CR=1 FL=1